MRPRVDYFESKEEEDPFPDEYLLDPVDAEQHGEVVTAIQGMVARAVDAGLDGPLLKKLKTIVSKHTDVFLVGYSLGRPERFKPLKKELVPDARLFRVRFHNYTKEQRAFLTKTFTWLVQCKVAYANPTSPWAEAPLFVHKPGPTRLCFTMNLRLVYLSMVAKQFSMKNT